MAGGWRLPFRFLVLGRPGLSRSPPTADTPGRPSTRRTWQCLPGTPRPLLAPRTGSRRTRPLAARHGHGSSRGLPPRSFRPAVIQIQTLLGSRAHRAHPLCAAADSGRRLARPSPALAKRTPVLILLRSARPFLASAGHLDALHGRPQISRTRRRGAFRNSDRPGRGDGGGAARARDGERKSCRRRCRRSGRNAVAPPPWGNRLFVPPEPFSDIRTERPFSRALHAWHAA